MIFFIFIQTIILRKLKFYNKIKGENLKEFVIKKNIGFATQETVNSLGKLPLGLQMSVNESLLPNVLITDISVAEKILGHQGEITRFELTGPASSDRQILEKLDLRLVHSNSQADLEQLTESFHLNLRFLYQIDKIH